MADMRSTEALVKRRAVEIMKRASLGVLVATQARPPVPFRTGQLQLSHRVGFVEAGSTSVSFTMTADTPYARHVQRMERYTTWWGGDALRQRFHAALQKAVS